MKIKKTHVYALLALIIISIAAFYYFYFRAHSPNNAPQAPGEKEKDKILWLVDEDGYLYYPSQRGEIKFRRDNYSRTNTTTVSKVIFQSKDTNIYGLLVLPVNFTHLLPGVVLLPGAGVSKESELRLAEKISGLGAAVLTIDQRGVGETGGIFPPIEADFQIFIKGEEPYQHKVVYDALRAYDLLKSAPFVDNERIIIAGESFGGRIATIAASIERGIKGVLIISSSGFDYKPKGDKQKDAFLESIDSDHYIDTITPRRLVIMQNARDKVIALNTAVNSYSKAAEPKRFVLVNDTTCNHGYCDSMYNGLASGLKFLFNVPRISSEIETK